MKKRTKNYPFLKIQKQRLNFHMATNCPNTVPSEKQFFRWVWHAMKNPYKQAEINLLLADETVAQSYNTEYRNKSYATNILSFALNEGEEILPDTHPILRGDLVMCPSVIEKEATEQNKTLDAHYAHLTIHGVLHLMGYDHIDKNDAIEMESLEISLLHQLGYSNPYLEN